MSIQMQMDEATEDANFDVLVIGAGMAGLTAARAMAQRGVRVCVLEARERVGGRVWSVKAEGGGIVELGAEFVHGRAPELWALIDETGAKIVEREGTRLREDRSDGLTDDDAQGDSIFEPLERLKDYAGDDIAFADWLAASDVKEDAGRALTNYVERFNAADARRIGVRSLGAQQKSEDAIDGDRAWHLPKGYVQLAEYLADRAKQLGAQVRLGCEVLGVRWSEGQVLAETTQGDFLAKQCLVTLPLGVVQRVNRSGGVQMEPEPQAVAQARRLAMGHASRFTIVFRERWWERSRVIDAEKLRAMSFLFTSERMPPVWWTAHPEAEALPALTGWMAGPGVSALEGKDAEELGHAACEELAAVFAMSAEVARSVLVATYTHDWAADPFSLGAYSYVPAGAMDAPEAMMRPEAETIFFAGEHTDVTGNWGTVHAAIRSGLRAAKQVLGNLFSA